ncbi:MAG: tagatose-bisphosphate aldolase [Phycisphaerales bacterium]|nr:tagatose-bisphosphate aldolase [Phycisphaerales bacterium]
MTPVSPVPPFMFIDPGGLTDDDLRLALVDRQPADVSVWRELAYLFHIMVCRTGERVGRLSLRVGHQEWTVLYNGHLGYAVDEPHRGHGYAERAARLVLPLAARHGLAELWVTCGPDNPASRRTIERLGGTYVETVDVPPDFPLPAGAVRQKMRYRLAVPPSAAPSPPLGSRRQTG